MKEFKVKVSDWGQDIEKYEFMKGYVNPAENLEV